MGLWRSGSRVALVALATVFLLVSVGAPAQALLTKLSVVNVTFDPNTPHREDTLTVTVMIKNTHTAEVRIKWIGVHFDWQATNSYVYDDRTSSPVPIPPDSMHTFTFMVPIPANANISSHSYYFKIDYETQSGSYSEKSDSYHDLVIVKYNPPVEVPFWQTPAFLIVILFFVMMAVVGISGVLIRRRRMRAELARKRLDAVATETTGAAEEDVELAQTVVKGRTPPSQTVQGAKWNAQSEKRYVGQPPIYNLLQGNKAPQQGGPTPMPQGPPQPMKPYVQQPRGQPPAPPELPPPIVPKEQTKLSQCPICGKMIRAHDTTCPGCGGVL